MTQARWSKSERALLVGLTLTVAGGALSAFGACASLLAPPPLTPAQAAFVAAGEAYAEEARVLRDAGEAFARGNIDGAGLARVRQQGVVLDEAWREVARAVAAGDPALDAKVDAMEDARAVLRATWEEVRRDG